MKTLTCFAVLAGISLFGSEARAGDWPMWRFDSGRGAATPDPLPAEMQLQWTRQLPEPMPAWPVTQALLQFDLQAEPVVMGERIFVPSSKNDSVTAFSTRSGEELWRFYADGPVRFAPVVDDGKVFFNSDDGCLYAVDAASGKLTWKVNGAPDRRWILGNQRLISMWPSRGGPVLHDGKLFFTASIWPFMGIFIHAVDPDSGEIVWTNSGDGTNYTVQPHSAPSFASVVPQGHLAANGSNLIVPGGRSTPAVYDTANGEQKYFKFDKRNGGHNVMAAEGLLFVAGHAYMLENGSPIGGGAPAVVDRENLMLIASDPSSILARGAEVKITSKETVDRKGRKIRENNPEYRELFRTALKRPAPGPWYLKAGDRMYAGGTGKIAAYDLKKPEPAWEAEIEGEAYTMLAGDDRLFVVTGDGLLHCFGAEKPAEVARHSLERIELKSSGGEWAERAMRLRQVPGTSEGYALVLGVESGRLIEELLIFSDLHVIAVDPDAEKIDSLRRRMDAAGFYGERFSAFAGIPAKEKFPPYLCNLITSEYFGREFDSSRDRTAKEILNLLRPYGGVAWLPAIFRGDSSEPGRDGIVKIIREGPLPDSDDWTHQYANAAQTVVSKDANVKAPFGVLWFGGPSHEGILPRHGHGPSPQVAGGRLFIEGADKLRAVDVYTGRLLWERELPGIGTYYNNTAHFAGAGEIGSNYVSMPDRVYAVLGDTIHALNTGTGSTEQEFKLPPGADGQSPFWGYIGVEGDYLIATSTPVGIEEKAGASGASKPQAEWARAKPLVPRRGKWQYLAGSDPAEDWAVGKMTGKEWKLGTAGFGYGDNDDETVIDMEGKFSRVYLRTGVDGGALREAKRLALQISYDDGFIAYLNGKEILRRNIKKGNGPKAEGIGSHEAGEFETIEIMDWLSHVRDGVNTLAVEGHNRSEGSSDFTLDPVLLARSDSVEKPKAAPEKKPAFELPTTRYASGSRRLVVFDRRSGDLLWQRDAQFNFRHNNIAVSGDRLFCVDKLSSERASALARRGFKPEGTPTLYALDLKSGDVLWKHSEDVFGTFLNYSAEHDIVLQAGSEYRDRAKDEIGEGMMALRGADGKVIWHEKGIDYGGPCLLWHERILTNGNGGFAVELLTGKKLDWTYNREYGCNTAVGSEHLITFRSGAAGFFDLANESGTGNLGGFRSSCTNNLIAANGVLNAPDYTRTCSCSYQNQTSLALIHMPEAEFWTFGGKANPKRIGINFGAPGDRRSEAGTLFVEYPNTGSRSDEVDVKVAGKEVGYVRSHASTIKGGPDPWLTASGIEGAEEIEIEVPDGLQGKSITVKLWFAETRAGVKAGNCVFDVEFDGRPVLETFDIAAEADGAWKGIVKEIPAVSVEKQLKIRLVPHKGDRAPILSAVELVLGE